MFLSKNQHFQPKNPSLVFRDHIQNHCISDCHPEGFWRISRKKQIKISPWLFNIFDPGFLFWQAMSLLIEISTLPAFSDDFWKRRNYTYYTEALGLKRDPQSMIYPDFVWQKIRAKNHLQRDIGNRFIILFWKYIK